MKEMLVFRYDASAPFIALNPGNLGNIWIILILYQEDKEYYNRKCQFELN
jgi:hypothetical protein